MKISIINGSPRGENSCTMRMCNPLIEGMKEAGAQVHLLHLAKLAPHHCMGCFGCWTKTPGKCVINDGFNEAVAECAGANLAVFAAPLYHFHMPGIMKNFLDRTIVLSEPWMITDKTRGNISHHPIRNRTIDSMLLLSPCGFPEAAHFAPYSDWFKAYAKIAGVRWCGEILRPMAEVLRAEKFQPQLAGYYADLKAAGKELVCDGTLSRKTELLLQRDLVPGGVAAMREHANTHWERMLGHPQPQNE